MSADQRDWVDYVDPAQFSCNVAMHLVIKGSFFEVVYGVDTLQPTNLAFKGAHLALEVNHHGEDLAKKCKQLWSCWWRKSKSAIKTKSLPEDAKWSMKWTWKMLFNVNKFILSEGLTPKFISKVEALFHIVEWVFKNMYKLELPPNMKVCLTFHVSSLRPFKVDTLGPNRKQLNKPPFDLIGGYLEYDIEGNIKCRMLRKKN